jgi:type IV pilus assembly protein PilV
MTFMTLHRSHRRRVAGRAGARGVVLIDALISILLLSVGLLAVVGLQTSMTKAQSAAKFRGDAAYLASEVIGTMWGDAANLASYATAACPSYARCGEWKTRVESALPGGTVAVTVGNAAAGTAGVVTLTIGWTTPNEGAHNYTTSTVILL